MERSDVMDAMGKLKLYGMRAAYDETLTTAVKRQHEPQQIIGDQRPITDELNRLFRCFDDNERLTLPMTRIVKFAVATAMRLDEICRVEWTDLDVDRRMLMIRDRKDPRNKTGNATSS